MKHIIFLHGKVHSDFPLHYRQFVDFAKSKEFNVIAPIMGWATNLGYTHSPKQTLEQIKHEIQKLYNNNDEIYIVGHSMGAIALGYYEPYIREYINGIVLVSPGHIINRKTFFKMHGETIELARQLVAQGLGEKVTLFPSWNGVCEYQLSSTPNLYLEWACNNEIDFDKNLYDIESPTLFVTSNDTMDTGIYSIRPKMFDRIPAEYKDFQVLESTHGNVLEDGKEIIIDWINKLSSDHFNSNNPIS